jgi:hypothetical protein
MHNECHSDFDPNFVSDILAQLPGTSQADITVEHVQRLEINSAVRNDKTISCPNCISFFWTEEEDLVELFVTCPACQTSFCVTCEHVLGPYKYLDHVCPSGSSDKQQTSIRHEVAEILTQASTSKCKNPNCRLSRDGTPITKEDGDCNVIKCKECKTLFCYICCKNLGLRSMEAHEKFPHENVFIPNAPKCWLFDEIAVNQTIEEAMKLRKVFRLSEYFISLQINKKAKQILVAQCRDLLGDLYENIVLEPNSSLEKCTIL